MHKFTSIIFSCFFLFSTTALANPLNSIPRTTKINMVWEPSFVKEADSFAKLPPVKGVNIVSPCWFDIINVNGFIRNKATLTYAKTVHKKGYKLWALITNSFNPEITHRVLQNKEARDYVIEQMLTYAKQYEIDGYNLDFENIRDSDRDLLTNFVQEIYIAMKKENLIVSMDITVPSCEPYWSNCYDRKALGDIVDYVMLMAYDEHHPHSQSMGSTASINWVEKNLKATMTTIPAEKLLLGLPLYMRIWQENADTGKVIGKTLSMPQAEELILKKNIKPLWLENQGQYYLEYIEEKTTYKVWQENRHSLELKAALVNNYNLAGTACWRKGFETPDIWPALEERLK